jgi:hypothetical protein
MASSLRPLDPSSLAAPVVLVGGAAAVPRRAGVAAPGRRAFSCRAGSATSAAAERFLHTPSSPLLQFFFPLPLLCCYAFVR